MQSKIVSKKKVQVDSVPQSRVFSELSRCVLNDTTVESAYRAGYTTITVRGVFDGSSDLASLVHRIAFQRLKDVSVEQ